MREVTGREIRAFLQAEIELLNDIVVEGMSADRDEVATELRGSLRLLARTPLNCR